MEELTIQKVLDLIGIQYSITDSGEFQGQKMVFNSTERNPMNLTITEVNITDKTTLGELISLSHE